MLEVFKDMHLRRFIDFSHTHTRYGYVTLYLPDSALHSV